MDSSDLDLAVLDTQSFSESRFLAVHGGLAAVFSANEIDLSLLNRADPYFDLRSYGPAVASTSISSSSSSKRPMRSNATPIPESFAFLNMCCSKNSSRESTRHLPNRDQQRALERTIDRQFVQRKLELIAEELGRLLELNSLIFEELTDDFVKMAAVERIIERIANRAIDINQHIIARAATGAER